MDCPWELRPMSCDEAAERLRDARDFMDRFAVEWVAWLSVSASTSLADAKRAAFDACNEQRERDGLPPMEGPP